MTEEAFKDKRKIAKRKFSLALRKLDGSLVIGLDVVSMKPQASSLEQAYEDLLCVHLEYMDAYPQPDDTYMNEIDENFNATLKKYNQSYKTYNNIEIQKQANSLLRTVSLGFKKLDAKLSAKSCTKFLGFENIVPNLVLRPFRSIVIDFRKSKTIFQGFQKLGATWC